MKLFGHPLHTMMVHFPVAFVFAAGVAACAAHITGLPIYAGINFYALGAAAITGWISVILGALDFILVIKENKDAVNTALYHAGINSIPLTIATVLACIMWKGYPAIEIPGVPMVLTELLAVLLITAGNYYGGQLIFKYGIGQIKKHV